jgi:hypothetical protein
MFLTRKFMRLNKVNIAIVIFLILFTLIHLYRPILMYTKEGGFRQFGVGYKHKTVIPIWVVAIIVAIFSYLAVLFI